MALPLSPFSQILRAHQSSGNFCFSKLFHIIADESWRDNFRVALQLDYQTKYTFAPAAISGEAQLFIATKKGLLLRLLYLDKQSGNVK